MDYDKFLIVFLFVIVTFWGKLVLNQRHFIQTNLDIILQLMLASSIDLQLEKINANAIKKS